MSTQIDMTHAPDGKRNYLRWVEDGFLPWQAATTYEYVCHGCGGHTLLDVAGGTFDCDCKVPGDQIEVFVILAGRRERMGTMRDIAGTP